MRSTVTLVRTVLDSQFLLVGLITAMIVGVLYPATGVWLGEQPLTKLAPAGIFFISGLKLRTSEARRALGNARAMVWGVLSTLVFTCALGVQLATLAPALSVAEFQRGLAVFLCMPCTITSGAALAAQANGDFALALLLTVACSVLGVFSVPLMLQNLLNLGADVALPVVEMTHKLFLMVLLPLLLGKAAATALPPVEAAVDRLGKPLTHLSNALIILVPWVEISRSAARGVLQAVPLVDHFSVVALYSAIHLAFVAWNLAGSRVLGLGAAMTKSVVLVASGKALPLALVVVGLLPAAAGDKGLLALPAIWGWAMQIVIDSPLAAAMARRRSA